MASFFIFSMTALLFSLAFVLLVACSLRPALAQKDPVTDCSPVTVDTFSVATGSSSTEGRLLSVINGT